MRVKERTKKEIEQKFVGMNDYLKMEYLKACLHNELDFDTKKFVHVKLSGLYESKGMLLEAGKMMRAAGEINTQTGTKISDFMKAVELFVRGGDYEMADAVKKRALAIAPVNSRNEIEKMAKEFYKIQARICVESNKRKHAIGIYEKMLTMDIDPLEKKEVQESLLKIYEGIGDYSRVRNLRRKVYGT